MRNIIRTYVFFVKLFFMMARTFMAALFRYMESESEPDRKALTFEFRCDDE